MGNKVLKLQSQIVDWFCLLFHLLLIFLQKAVHLFPSLFLPPPSLWTSWLWNYFHMFKRIREDIPTISHFEHVIKCFGFFPWKTMCFITTSRYMLIQDSAITPYTRTIYILKSHLFYTIFLVLILCSHKSVSFLPKYSLGSRF